jgi:hypothetical protein
MTRIPDSTILIRVHPRLSAVNVLALFKSVFISGELLKAVNPLKSTGLHSMHSSDERMEQL